MLRQVRAWIDDRHVARADDIGAGSGEGHRTGIACNHPADERRQADELPGAPIKERSKATSPSWGAASMRSFIPLRIGPFYGQQMRCLSSNRIYSRALRGARPGGEGKPQVFVAGRRSGLEDFIRGRYGRSGAAKVAPGMPKRERDYGSMRAWRNW